MVEWELAMLSLGVVNANDEARVNAPHSDD